MSAITERVHHYRYDASQADWWSWNPNRKGYECAEPGCGKHLLDPVHQGGVEPDPTLYPSFQVEK